MSELPELPLARIRLARRWSWWWLLPLLALAGAGWLTWTALSQRGTLVLIEFNDGHGIKPGDLLRYRGIEAGRVQQARFSADLGKIQVELRLNPSAADLARAGSRYWIVRPQLDLSGASGLETLVGANYLGVLPGDGAKQLRFTGLETPPLRDLMETGGLEIVLSSHSQGALQRGAPIHYRQAHIGTILSVELAADANAVEVLAYIKPAYAHLIRERVRFWKSGGARLDAGWFSGLSVQMDSVQALLAGGISLAVPPQAGKPVAAGAHFSLEDEPQPEWLQWQPSLGSAGSHPQPALVAASLRWTPDSYLWRWQNSQRRGWLLPVAGGLLGPADLLTIPPGSQANSAVLELQDRRVVLMPRMPLQATAPGLALLTVEHGYPAWPRHRAATQPEDTFLSLGDASRRALTARQYQAETGAWRISAAENLDASWHGAAVLAVSDEMLLGILLVDDDGARVILLPADANLQALPPADAT